MKLSVIMPVLNEGAMLEKALGALQTCRSEGTELILVDGGSDDTRLEISAAQVDRLIHSEPGRARQMNAGAAVAHGDVLLFLHADTGLPQVAYTELLRTYECTQTVWSRFNVHLSGRHFMFRLIERMMNWRSCLTGIATGDQAMAVRSDIFRQLGGFADIPLMEDVELSKRLKKINRPVCLRGPVMTSSRRWEHRGIIRTVLLMWQLRLDYYLGASPHRLVERYYPSSTKPQKHD